MQALLTLLLLLACPVWAVAAGAEDLPHWRALRDQSNQALLANDCRSARQLLLQLQLLMPGNPRNIYNLAACNARLGARTSALQGLQRLAHMGLVFDPASDPDFVALAAAPQFKAVVARMSANRAPQSQALLAFDLDTGAERRRIECPTAGPLGDMLVSPAGEVFVSEGLHGAVYRLRVDAQRFERLDTDGELLSAQTPALSADGQTLYVPDYVRGLAAITLASRKLRWLQAADDISLTGIDGLYIHDGALLAVQNGVNPERLLRVTADLRHQQVLEQQWPGLGEATHGAIIADCFYFLANTGWDSYDQRGVRRATAAPVLSSVWVTPLTARADCHRDFRRDFH
jgi:hypothetical protein